MQAPFDLAVTTYGPTVLRVCRAILGGGSDADEAWSETFLSALRSWPDLDDSTNVEAWLVRVAHHRSVDLVRRAARAELPAGTGGDLDLLATIEREHDGPPCPSGVWEAVATLPTKQRLCVAYRYLGGLAYADIADIVGGSEAAARRSASDGVARLRQTFDRADVQVRASPQHKTVAARSGKTHD